MSVANQKIVQIAPRTKRDSEHLFAMMNIDALQAAVQDLKGSALKMWLYFNKNQDGYKFELSQKACQAWGIKKDSYYDGIRELELKGYLIPIYAGSNIYKFYEMPPAEKPKEFSENQNRSMDFQKKQSDFPQRNNINNTEIKQNRTMAHPYCKSHLDDNAFAKGESGGGGKAATASNDGNYVDKILGRFPKQQVYENPNILTNKYF